MKKFLLALVVGAFAFTTAHALDMAPGTYVSGESTLKIYKKGGKLRIDVETEDSAGMEIFTCEGSGYIEGNIATINEQYDEPAENTCILTFSAGKKKNTFVTSQSVECANFCGAGSDMEKTWKKKK